jgi:hypothetical protein
VVLGDVFSVRLAIEDGATLRGGVDPSKAGDPLIITEESSGQGGDKG